ncbi:hypothetical protein [Vibrio sp. 10N.247.310.34]|uniref:hypothetical protein n=2 Tax=unclassified Vibrio TaxID=2614977 RepID=UPI00354D285F
MPKLTVNDLQGFAFFKARDNIGMSISKVCEMTGLNRNKLSQFEQEKGTLAANEKRTLKHFYEERGHDFANLEPLDGESIKAEYQANKAELSESLDSLMTNEVGDALISFVDAHHDLITANGYLVVMESEEIEVMPPEYQELTTNLIHHFEADKQGQFEKKGGFLGGAGQERGQKFLALLAYLKLQDLQCLHSDALSLSLKTVKKNSDNERLLEEIKGNLNLGSLEEFKQYTSALVK